MRKESRPQILALGGKEMVKRKGEQKLESMAIQGQQEDSDRLGRLIIQILGLLGGLAALLIAALDLLASLVGL